MDRRQKIAGIATAHAGCSSVLEVDLYTDAVIRPADRIPRIHSFYFGNPKLSTCALFAVRCLESAGCLEPECVESYFPEGGRERDAMADIQVLAHRFEAWLPSSPTLPPMLEGDIWIIVDDAGGNAHTGVCTADAVVTAGGSWSVATVEGGQVPVDADGNAVGGQGSSAQKAFTRHFVRVGARWKLGDRWLLGYASAASMPVPDDLVEDADAKADTIPVPDYAHRDSTPPTRPNPDDTLKPT